ncbi:MAG: DUF5076 domain-containing protein [Hellea sp.]
MSADIHALAIPPAVYDASHAVELVRFWVADGIDHVSLRIDAASTESEQSSEPHTWGVILADIAKHAVNAITQSTFDENTKEQIFAQLEQGFAERLKEKVNFSGQLTGDGNAH